VTEFRIKIVQADFEELEQLLFTELPKESAAFALAGAATHRGGTDVVVRRPIAIPDEHFSVQSEYHLRIATAAVNGLCALCEANGLGAILCHSHPEDLPYSPSDDYGECRIIEVLRAFIPDGAPTASLLFFPGGVRGRVWLPGEERPIPVSEIVVIGRALRRIRPDGPDGDDAVDEALFDRQVRAFGREGQALIGRTKVGIVGVGGTGSPTVEQLVRLGVRDLVLVDPDDFEHSNLTRVYGTFASSLAETAERAAPKKVDLVAAHLKRIKPETLVEPIPGNVVVDEVARKLLDRDVIFLCTDDHWGRSIVNQVAYQYSIPTINLGMRIAAEDERIRAASGAIDVVRPGLPCLWCSQFLRADRIAAESMPRRDREAREREGYVEGLERTGPSVVSMTTALSGMAVTLFLQFVTDFMGQTGEIARLNYDVMKGTVRRGRAPINDACICGKVRGFGDLRLLNTLPNATPLGQRVNSSLLGPGTT